MVLVVDDDDAIRNAVRDILELIEVAALDAPNGEEAIALFKAQGNDIKVVLLDLQLPRMSGEQVFRVLREIDPAIPIILSSGYDHSEVPASIMSEPATSFLRKPYAVDTLLAAIEAIIS